MLLLGLDTATPALSAALVERRPSGDRVLDRGTVEPPITHSSVLPSLLEGMLAKAGARLDDLAAMVVGLGPGSFTGLRIGLATAKGLCWAARIPLVGASSLGSMALAASADVPEGTLLVPCLDARKHQVYAALFRKHGAALKAESPELAAGARELLDRLRGQPATLFGLGREAYPELSATPAPATRVRTPDAVALVGLVSSLPPFDASTLFALEPHYVRPSDSEWTAKPKSR
jgi:tRNA threonylcarbamoyladenosine biosynthesis protein TsaB